MRIGLLHSTIRGDEKLILEAARKRNIEVKLIDIRDQALHKNLYENTIDIALERSVSTVKGNYAADFYESVGIPVVNSPAIAAVCEDKFRTSLLLEKHNIPTLDFAMVFTVEQAMRVIEELGGFPVVIKPAEGSWGRLLAKVNDIDALEAIIDHKNVLGSPTHKAYYIQEFAEKNGRDIRAFAIDGETICAIYRDSDHWITNTARGGKASNCVVTDEIRDICRRASAVIGGGILAFDLMETPDGLKINEINHTMEFKNSEEPTGVSISGAIIDYCVNYLTK